MDGWRGCVGEWEAKGQPAACTVCAWGGGKGRLSVAPGQCPTYSLAPGQCASRFLLQGNAQYIYLLQGNAQCIYLLQGNAQRVCLLRGHVQCIRSCAALRRLGKRLAA
eukprot:352476-Chlamydomonas_euryale.AAC.9